MFFVKIRIPLWSGWFLGICRKLWLFLINRIIPQLILPPFYAFSQLKSISILFSPNSVFLFMALHWKTKMQNPWKISETFICHTDYFSNIFLFIWMYYKLILQKCPAFLSNFWSPLLDVDEDWIVIGHFPNYL